LDGFSTGAGIGTESGASRFVAATQLPTKKRSAESVGELCGEQFLLTSPDPAAISRKNRRSRLKSRKRPIRRQVAPESRPKRQPPTIGGFFTGKPSLSNEDN